MYKVGVCRIEYVHELEVHKAPKLRPLWPHRIHPAGVTMALVRGGSREPPAKTQSSYACRKH